MRSVRCCCGTALSIPADRYDRLLGGVFALLLLSQLAAVGWKG